jgi:hypothetical protein
MATSRSWLILDGVDHYFRNVHYGDKNGGQRSSDDELIARMEKGAE